MPGQDFDTGHKSCPRLRLGLIWLLWQHLQRILERSDTGHKAPVSDTPAIQLYVVYDGEGVARSPQRVGVSPPWNGGRDDRLSFTVVVRAGGGACVLEKDPA